MFFFSNRNSFDLTQNLYSSRKSVNLIQTILFTTNFDDVSQIDNVLILFD